MNLAKLLADLFANAIRLAVDRFQVSGILDEFRGHLLHGQDMIDEAC